jgi:hypothetical protein
MVNAWGSVTSHAEDVHGVLTVDDEDGAADDGLWRPFRAEGVLLDPVVCEAPDDGGGRQKAMRTFRESAGMGQARPPRSPGGQRRAVLQVSATVAPS